MPQLQQVTNVLGAGTYAAHQVPNLALPCQELGAFRTLLTMGRLELNRATASEPTRFGRDGVLDVSPAPSELQQAIGFAGSDDVAELNRDCWEPLARRMVERVVAAQCAAKLADGQTLWYQGIKTGHGKPAEEVLRELKLRLPRQFVVAASTLPDKFDQRDKLRDGYELFVSLKDEGIVETTFLVDNRSPLALTYGLDHLDRLQARALASLLAAQVHFSRNPSLTEVGRSLGDFGAFVGMAFASRSVVVARPAFGWGGLRALLPQLPQRGTGSVSDLILGAKEATTTALTEPQALGVEETIDLAQKPLYLIYTLPLPLGDGAGWVTVANELRRWLSITYPTAVPVFVSGAGTPNPRYQAAYWLQVSALFPMPDAPAPVAKILASPSPKRRAPTSRGRLQRAPHSNNGKVAAAEIIRLEAVR